MAVNKKNVSHHGVVKVTDKGEIEVFQIWNLNPLRSNISMLFYVLILYIFHGTDKENVFTDQELLKLEIISFILMTSKVILLTLIDWLTFNIVRRS